MTVSLPVYQDDECTIVVTPAGAGAARFYVTYLTTDAAGRRHVDARREAARVVVSGDDLDDLQRTMTGKGWVIERVTEPHPAGLRLLVHTSPNPFEWSRAGCPLSLRAAGEKLAITLSVPGLATPTINWSLAGYQLNNFFEQMLLGAYDGRGQKPESPPSR